MNRGSYSGLSCRELIKHSGRVAAASALAGMVLPHVHAGENNAIQLALIGCGGRGTGAAENALLAKGGPLKLVAMADVFSGQLSKCYLHLNEKFSSQMEVPEDRKFIGFDAYQKAMDCLRPGDIAIFTTPPAFRWVHFTYAIQKGLNVFMEKPVTVDGPSTRKLLKLAEESEKRNLKVGVGLMCRHCEARHELFDRIKSGQVGDLTMLRAYRMAGKTAMEASPSLEDFRAVNPEFKDITELLYQVKRFHSFIWASGGCYSDFLIHNIDECCWMKDAWPIKASGSGGRNYRGKMVNQNFDAYSIEYTFADGAKLFLEGRTIPGCHQEFASHAHGTKGSAVISQSGHTPAHCRIFKGQNPVKQGVVWSFGKEEPNPYQLEWDHLVDAIRNDRRYNEVKRGAEASLVTTMGRMAAHTGRIVTFDQMLNHEHELAPSVEKLTMESPAPVQADKSGKYAVPQPGRVTKREY